MKKIRILSFGQNKSPSWPLIVIFGYILLPIFFATSFILIAHFIFDELQIDRISWQLILYCVIGLIIGLCITMFYLLGKWSKLRQGITKVRLGDLVSDLNQQKQRYEFWYECPACGTIWNPGNVPANKLCPTDFLPLKEVDPVEKEHQED